MKLIFTWRGARTTKRHAKRSPKDTTWQEHKKTALRRIEDIIEHLNLSEEFEYNRITIRNQKTRWGSCSSKRNLNFNYRIVFLPQDLAVYLVVHEICHLLELNHSRKFWELVAQFLPDHKELRKKLNKIPLNKPTRVGV
jgi:predicted metal-dependent hydrolase